VGVFVIISVCIVSMVLLRHYERIGWLDAVFLVIDSMTHAHFGGYPTATASKAIMSFLSIFGVGVIVYLISIVVETVLSEELFTRWGVRSMEKCICDLKDHAIICGYGRVGSVVGEELKSNGIPYVVIERDERIVERITKEGQLAVNGDATDTEFLRKAGIERARFLVVVMGDDADSIVIILAAKELNPHIRVIVRASSEKMLKRMFQVGAERIVSPEYVGGLEIAESILQKQLAAKKGILFKEDIE
jgi:voltage-gated potassium channel